jgi:hypothetical protein
MRKLHDAKIKAFGAKKILSLGNGSTFLGNGHLNLETGIF